MTHVLEHDIRTAVADIDLGIFKKRKLACFSGVIILNIVRARVLLSHYFLKQYLIAIHYITQL